MANQTLSSVFSDIANQIRETRGLSSSDKMTPTEMKNSISKILPSEMQYERWGNTSITGCNRGISNVVVDMYNPYTENQIFPVVVVPPAVHIILQCKETIPHWNSASEVEPGEEISHFIAYEGMLYLCHYGISWTYNQYDQPEFDAADMVSLSEMRENAEAWVQLLSGIESDPFGAGLLVYYYDDTQEAGTQNYLYRLIQRILSTSSDGSSDSEEE